MKIKIAPLPKVCGVCLKDDSETEFGAFNNCCKKCKKISERLSKKNKPAYGRKTPKHLTGILTSC